MALTKHKLGEFLEPYDYRNKDLSVTLFQGISTSKVFTNPKQVAEDISSTKIVRKGFFAYNKATTRNGEKISIAYREDEDCAVSSAYQVFFIKEKAPLLPEYLLIFFNRPEFDRYARYNSWGSAHEFFTFEDMCDVEIELPDLPTQQKYVDIYKAMVANQQCYERGLEDLKLVCDGLIDGIKHTVPVKPVSDFLQEVDNRNDNGEISEVHGINITKQFMPSVADTNSVDLKKYKLVKKNQFAFSGMQTGRDECIRIALHKADNPIIISPAYTVFEHKNETILEEYVMMWFSRKESDRLGWFMSDSSIRSNLDLDRFYETKIPVPDKKTQRAIVDIYNSYTKRREINEKLKVQIKNICPILIKGSLEEGK